MTARRNGDRYCMHAVYKLTGAIKCTSNRTWPDACIHRHTAMYDIATDGNK